MAGSRFSMIVVRPMLPTRSKANRRGSPSPAPAVSPPARQRWLIQQLAAVGLMQPPTSAHPLRPRRADYVLGGRAVTFLVRATRPLLSGRGEG
jgi:hypothetical protein